MSEGNFYGVELTLGNGEQITLTAYGKGPKNALMNSLVANRIWPKGKIEIFEGNSLLATRIGEATCNAKARVISSGIRRTVKEFYIKILPN